MVESGKCASCLVAERDLVRGDVETLRKAREYNVRGVPTIVIDRKIKVVGKPDFPWVCGDDFYTMLERKFPLRPSSG